MRDDIFIHADSHLLTPAPAPACTIMGRGLCPLSIWHVWTLGNNESPYVFGGRPTPQDLAFGLIVCSFDQEQFGELLGSEEGLSKAIGEVVAYWLDMKLEDQHEAARNFLEYIQSGSVGPDYWEPEKWNPIKDRQRTPFEWVLVINLLREGICQTEAQAWNYPFNRARCWQAVVGELNGSRNYIDSKDRADIQKVNGHG